MNLRCVIPRQDLLGESPLWCVQTQSLLWLDIDGGKLQRFHPATGRHDVFAFDDRYVGSLALMHAPGRVLLGIELGLFSFDLATGQRAHVDDQRAQALHFRLERGDDVRCHVILRICQ